jgi:acyl-CoA synthetase (AMP-forming)/AMP-acid ligase II
LTTIPFVLDRVRAHVADKPDQCAFVFMQRHNDPGTGITWRELWDKASCLASQLPVSEPADKCGVLIFCNDEWHFVVSLLATWMRGAVVIPTSGSTNLNAVERNEHIFAVSQPDIILHDLSEQQATLLSDNANGAVMCHVPDCLQASPMEFDMPVQNTGSLVQFTSGSTSSPKAVLLSPKNVATNCAAITDAYSLDEHTVGVHWLPLHHDMGLVGSVIVPMWAGVSSVIMRPTVFIQRPIAWFEQISKRRATITSAPNFAYQRLTHSVAAEELEGLELSSLQNVIIGGEPVHKQALDDLMEVFGPYGLQAGALAPSYGLAEVTLLASTGKRLGGPVYSERHALRPVPALGSPVKGVSISIINEASGNECDDGELGAIQVSGDCVGRIVPAGQNWRDSDNPEPILTGDYGYKLNGDLYVTGRNTNKIIVRGKNIFAEDVELLVSKTSDMIHSNNVAAFGIEKDGTEALCILVEQLTHDTQVDIGTINQSIVGTLGVKPDHIALLRRSTLPRTSSGKVRRSLARSQFLAGAYSNRTLEHASQTHY